MGRSSLNNQTALEWQHQCLQFRSKQENSSDIQTGRSPSQCAFFGCSDGDLSDLVTKSPCENCVHACELFHTWQEDADCLKPPDAYTVFYKHLSILLKKNHFISEKLIGIYGGLALE